MDNKFLLFVLINSLGNFALGYNLLYLSVISNHVLSILKEPSDDPNNVIGELISLVPFGAIFGCLLCVLLLKRFTKRQIFIATDAINIIFTLLMLTDDINFFRIGRFCQGIYIGIASILTSKYLVDYCLQKDLSFAMIVGSIYCNLGFLLGSVLAIFMPLTFEQSNLYTIIILIPMILSTIRLMATLFVYKYDTPIDREKQGLKNNYETLRAVYNSVDEMKLLVQEHKNQIISSKQPNKQNNLVYMGIFMMVVQNLSGSNAIGFYTNIMFYQLYPDEMASRYLTFGFILFGGLASFLTPIMMKSYGLKGLILKGCIWIGSIVLSLAAFSYLYESSQEYQAYFRYPCCILILFYNFVFSFSLGPCPWSICGSQLSDSDMVYVALSSWGSTTLVGMVFPAIRLKLGMPLCFGFFSLSCALAYVVFQQYLSEDKKKKL